MKDICHVQYSLVVISLIQYFASTEDIEVDENFRQSDIERDVTEITQLGFTTRCYEDLPPLSVEVDGAPQVAPVVYGDEYDFTEDEGIKTDDEVKKLREEFFEKHKKNVGKPENHDHDKGVRNNIPHEFNEVGLRNLNETDLKKDENIEKIHPKVEHGDTNNVDVKEKILKQHWNGEQIEVQDRKKPQFELFPKDSEPFPKDSEPGYKHGSLQQDFHKEIYGDEPNMELKNKIMNEIDLKNPALIKKENIHFQDKQPIEHNIHKVNHINNKLNNLLNLKNNQGNKEPYKGYKKMMNIELQETTNAYQHYSVQGPGCGLKKLPISPEKNVPHKKQYKLKRGKRNVKSTRHTRSPKTTAYYMDVDGRFRDIDQLERERNAWSSEEAKRTQPDWIHDNGYRPQTEKKFRPRPPLHYNRVAKEPMDYGSYDKSEFWKMMTETVVSGTLPANFYHDLPTPELPNTDEAYAVCRENFTTSECFRYPDISRLRDTKERRFMKKYYHKQYSDLMEEE